MQENKSGGFFWTQCSYNINTTVIKWAQPYTHCVQKNIHQLLISCITVRKINQFKWKFQTNQLMKCRFYASKIICILVKYSLLAANRTWVKVPLQQWDLPLATSISLNSSETVTFTQQNAYSGFYFTDDKVLMGRYLILVSSECSTIT